MNSLFPAALAAVLSLPAPVAGAKLNGPHVHGNLAVFLIEDPPPAAPGKKYLTLQQAMAEKKVVVHETGNVNELAVENLTRNEEILIQGGDIVKGGQQDRLISNDFILAPRSGRVPVASFCVEQGRWAARGAEPVKQFSTAHMSANRSVLVAARSNNQRKVWDKVAEYQVESSGVVGGVIAPAASPTSLALTMETPALESRAAAYVEAIGKRAGSLERATGAVFAIDGRFVSADRYASPGLFAAMWPKLLRAAAMEALARPAGKGTPSPKPEAALAWLNEAEAPAEQLEKVDRRVTLSRKESAKIVKVESRDGAVAVHKNYLSK